MVPYFEDFEIGASHFFWGRGAEPCDKGVLGVEAVSVFVFVVVGVLCCAALYCNFFWTRADGRDAQTESYEDWIGR